MEREERKAMQKMLGLERDYQLDIFMRILSSAEARGIPFEDIPAMARNLERLDWGDLLVASQDAADLLGTTDRHARRLPETAPFWMTPVIELGDSENTRSLRLWLKDKVAAYRKVRDEKE